MLEHTLSRDPALGRTPARSLDDWTRLDRFLLGYGDGTYHVDGCELGAERAGSVTRCLAIDGIRLLDRIVELSQSGRAPKNDPAIFSLAMAAKLGDEHTRRAAYAALPRVCRIATQLMRFADHAQRFGGWGRGMRKAVGSWFNARPAGELAVQLATYQGSHGWSNRDLLRLAHPRAASPSHDRLFAWAVKTELPEGAFDDPALALIVAIDELRTAKPDPHEAARIIRDHGVPADCVPRALLRSPEVWDALAAAMPVPELLRNLPAMTRVGLLATGSAAATRIARKLRDGRTATELHPIALLAALVSYRAGRARGQDAWLPVVSIVDALEAALAASFAAVAPTGTRMLVALDVSSSMASGTVAGVPGLTPRLASAAMATCAASEREPVFVAFTAGAGGLGGKWGGGASHLTALSITPRQRLDDVVAQLGALPIGGTDCALPMIWAQHNRVDVDTFVVYTDNETWAGNVQPARALRDYRDARGIPAKLVVVGMTSNGFGIADPDDAGMLDVVGFDPSVPPVLSDFARA